MYRRICMKTKFRQLHFRGRNTLHKIGEFYLSDPGWQPQIGQNCNFGSQQSKNKKLKNNKLLFYIYVPNPFYGQKMKENYFWSRSRVDRFQRDCHLTYETRRKREQWAKCRRIFFVKPSNMGFIVSPLFFYLRSRERAKYEPILHRVVLFLSFSRTLFDRYIFIYE